MIFIENLTFAYPDGEFCLWLERFVAAAGSRTVIRGPSGSGKTTLLHLLAGLLPAGSGSVEVGGRQLAGLGETRRRAFRRERVGLVFQDARLIDALSVRDNILVAEHCRGLFHSPRVREGRCRELAERLGITHLLDQRSDRISQGEAQRAAIARALLFDPPVLLADEPTASLDEGAARETVELLVSTAREHGATLVVASHDPLCAAACEEHFDLGPGPGRSSE